MSIALFRNNPDTKQPSGCLQATVPGDEPGLTLEKYSGGIGSLKTSPLDSADLLRWWHQHHTQRLSQEADTIRNGLLQEICAARRQLELLSQSLDQISDQTPDQTPGTPHRYTPCLAKLEQVYSTLQNLSDHLSSPHLKSGLPLALQHAIAPWREKLPLTTIFPKAWIVEPAELTQLLINFVGSLCQDLAKAPSLPSYCELQLTSTHHRKTLNVCIQYAQPADPFHTHSNREASSLVYMLKTFQTLTQGNYTHDYQPQECHWILHWS